jgi:hypothetical protein
MAKKKPKKRRKKNRKNKAERAEIWAKEDKIPPLKPENSPVYDLNSNLLDQLSASSEERFDADEMAAEIIARQEEKRDE